MLKEYADGKTIELEIMYGTTEKVNISSKLFFCSNPAPNFKTEGGIENRYKQLSFNSHFHTDYIEDNFDTLQFDRGVHMSLFVSVWAYINLESKEGPHMSIIYIKGGSPSISRAVRV